MILKKKVIAVRHDWLEAQRLLLDGGASIAVVPSGSNLPYTQIFCIRNDLLGVINEAVSGVNVVSYVRQSGIFGLHVDGVDSRIPRKILDKLPAEWELEVPRV